ncbi:phage head-tail joining protein [Orrella marina]|uniref:Uncharacterized protein n=1 Tax=Orrella marina TaxID=2163011 RepID=A0A2R4XF05_9BURK|nr:hypothetical protein [Orrella marina]AWB32370.1 hypothetical protein DBV39_00095 [Orrella marina]
MAYTQKDLDAIEKAIAGSELEVQYGDKRIRFRSMDELERARDRIKLELNRAAGRRPKKIVRVRNAGKGLR